MGDGVLGPEAPDQPQRLVEVVRPAPVVGVGRGEVLSEPAHGHSCKGPSP